MEMMESHGEQGKLQMPAKAIEAEESHKREGIPWKAKKLDLDSVLSAMPG